MKGNSAAHMRRHKKMYAQTHANLLGLVVDLVAQFFKVQ